jgi:hypothetical protein
LNIQLLVCLFYIVFPICFNYKLKMMSWHACCSSTLYTMECLLGARSC